MFPQVAPKFFTTRDQGPKNLGKDPAAQRRGRRGAGTNAGTRGRRQGPRAHAPSLTT